MDEPGRCGRCGSDTRPEPGANCWVCAAPLCQACIHKDLWHCGHPAADYADASGDIEFAKAIAFPMEPIPAPCPLCEAPTKTEPRELAMRFDCDACGTFEMTRTALELWGGLQGASLAIARTQAREHLGRLRRFAALPLVIADDVRGWARSA